MTRMEPFFKPPKIAFNVLSPERARVDPQFINRVMARWDRGLDTKSIAIEMMRSEPAVYAALCVGREQRRQEAEFERGSWK